MTINLGRSPFSANFNRCGILGSWPHFRWFKKKHPICLLPAGTSFSMAPSIIFWGRLIKKPLSTGAVLPNIPEKNNNTWRHVERWVMCRTYLFQGFLDLKDADLKSREKQPHWQKYINWCKKKQKSRAMPQQAASAGSVSVEDVPKYFPNWTSFGVWTLPYLRISKNSTTRGPFERRGNNDIYGFLRPPMVSSAASDLHTRSWTARSLKNGGNGRRSFPIGSR